MEIKDAGAVYFSPGGSTKAVAVAVASGIGECREYDFTSRTQELDFAPGSVAVFAAPVFGLSLIHI